MKKALDDCRGAFYFMFLLTFIITVFSVAPILYMMNVFDRVIPTNSTVTLISLLSLVLGLFIFWTALEWLRTRLMIRISLRIDWDMAADVFDACFKKSLNHKDPNVHQVMGDMLTLRQFMTGRSIIAVVDAPFGFFFIFIGYLIHPLLAAFMAGATILMAIITLTTQKATAPAIRAAADSNAEANRLAAAGLRNAETTLAMGMLPDLRRRWHSRHRAFLQYQVNSSEASGFIGMLGGVLTKAMPMLQMTVAVLLAGAQLISVGGVIAANFLMAKAIGPLRDLISNWPDIVKARLAYERLEELLDLHEADQAKMSLPAPVGNVSAQKLTITVGKSGKVILNQVSFDLPAGQALAIVGPNSAGKSTLLKAILGLWKPTEGSVRIDGAEASDWDHADLGPHVGYVSQTTSLFEATVAENISRLGELDPEKVVEAAQAVGIHDMILGFPNGYDTILNNGDIELSGGQAQRVSIARAFYGNPKLIVLDEPNSNLDENAEQALVNGLNKARQAGATIIFSSHRPRLIAMADWLLVLKEGNQVGFGRTREMINVDRNVPPKTLAESKPRPAADDAETVDVNSGATANAEPSTHRKFDQANAMSPDKYEPRPAPVAQTPEVK